MSSRPSRSSSIPIPRNASTSSSSRNIESVISIPFIPSSRHQPPTSPTNITGRSVPDVRRVASHATRSVSTTSNQLSTSPSTSTLRSTSRVSTFEPRVVRGSPHDHPHDAETSTTSISPSQARRSSLTTRSSGPPRPVVPQHIFAKTPVSFARPSYLEFCAMRQLLQTDPLPGPIPSRKASSISNTRPQIYAPSYSPSDEDDGVQTPPLIPRSVPAATPAPPRQKILLPSRWSELDRHPNLTLGHDGREVSYTGLWAVYFGLSCSYSRCRDCHERGQGCRRYPYTTPDTPCVRYILLWNCNYGKGAKSVCFFLGYSHGMSLTWPLRHITIG